MFNLESFTIGETDNNNGEESIEHPLLPMTVEFLIKHIRYGGCQYCNENCPIKVC